MRLRTDRRAQRKADVAKRAEAWEKLSFSEQLSALDARLGKGVGAKKQRARLQAKIAKSK